METGKWPLGGSRESQDEDKRPMPGVTVQKEMSVSVRVRTCSPVHSGRATSCHQGCTQDRAGASRGSLPPGVIVPAADGRAGGRPAP